MDTPRRRYAWVALVAVGGCTSLLGNDFTIEAVEGTGGQLPTPTTTTAGGGGLAPSQCANERLDDEESDVDCGGSTCPPCDLGQTCVDADDCESGFCLDGACDLEPCDGACESWQTCDQTGGADVCTPGATLFVNLDGGTFSYGPDDDAALSIQEVSNEALPANMDPYGGTAFDRTALLDAVEALFVPFNVEVTGARPNDDRPYQMVVVTPSGSPFAPDQKIFAPPPDCGNADDDNVAFVIFSAQSGATEGINPGQQAVVVAKAYGVLMGLEEVNGVTDVMHNQLGSGTRSFESLCHGRPMSTTWSCVAQHMAGCNGNPDLQNSFAELESLIGLSP